MPGVVLLIRNPYNALKSEWNRKTVKKQKKEKIIDKNVSNHIGVPGKIPIFFIYRNKIPVAKN